MPGRAQTPAVTPAGVRDGDPAALAGLCARRGPAVLAYCEELCPPELASRAAAEAFARFRAAVVAADDAASLDPEGVLLGATRRATAALASPPGRSPSLRDRLAGRARAEPCARMHALLVGRAEGALSPADEARLVRHLERCAACRELEAAFRRAEQAYRDPPDRSVPPETAGIIAAALAAAAPVKVGASTGHARAAGNGAAKPEAERAERAAPHAAHPDPDGGPEATEPPAEERPSVDEPPAEPVDERVPVADPILTAGPPPPEPSADPPHPQPEPTEPAPLPLHDSELEDDDDVEEGYVEDYEDEYDYEPPAVIREDPPRAASPRGGTPSERRTIRIADRRAAEAAGRRASSPARTAGSTALPRARTRAHLRHHEPGHHRRHGAVRAFVLPATVVVAGLIAAMAIAGVFGGNRAAPERTLPIASRPARSTPLLATPSFVAYAQRRGVVRIRALAGERRRDLAVLRRRRQAQAFARATGAAPPAPTTTPVPAAPVTPVTPAPAGTPNRSGTLTAGKVRHGREVSPLARQPPPASTGPVYTTPPPP